MKKGHYLKSAVCLLLLLPASGAFAGAGTEGGEFLRIIHSPRAVAMGESGAGAYGDLLGALSLNPAALARTGYKEAAFTYNAWLEDIATQQAAYAQPLGPGALAVSVMALSMPSIDGYNNSGAYAGKVDAGDLAAGLSYGLQVWDEFRDPRYGLFAGTTLKYAREKLAGVSAGAFLADAGALWIAPAGRGSFSLGLSAQSLGSGFKFDSVTDPAPAVYRAGAAYVLLAAGDPITLSADVRKSDYASTAVGGGAEYQVWRTVSIRGGYVSGEDLGGGLRLGGGVTLKLLQFDYSLSSYGKMGPAHRFSLSYKFDKPVAVTRYFTVEQERSRVRTSEARTLIVERRYYEAIIALNEALSLDPANKEALEQMRKARRLLEAPDK